MFCAQLYKHQYILAGWAWQRGITRAEYWNEVTCALSLLFARRLMRPVRAAA